MIEFPEPAVQYIKVFVGEVSGDLVDIFLFVNLQKSIEKIAASNLSTRDTTGVTSVDAIKDPSNDSDSIFLLEFGMIAQEFKALYTHI